jgi:hypothetical protein
MKIWYVNTDMENACAWSTKKQAIQYFKNQCSELNWSWVIVAGDEENENDCVTYEVKTGDYKFLIWVEPLFLDEEPYYD